MSGEIALLVAFALLLAVTAWNFVTGL